MEDSLITTVSHAELSRLQADLEQERTARLRAEIELARLRLFISYYKIRKQPDARNIVLNKEITPIKQKPAEDVESEWVETITEVEPDWMDIGDGYQYSASSSES